MPVARYLRDAALFAPCYIALDWTSYIDPVGPFNITPWNPQPALAVVWMMVGGLAHAPAVLASIVLADIVVRGAPGGYLITALTGLALTGGYMALAGALLRFLRDTALRTTRQLTLFSAIVFAGTAFIGAAFIGMLGTAGQLRDTPAEAAWLRFWIGDAVGILVTAPLLFAAADPARRAALSRLALRREGWLQAAVLVASVWLIFGVIPGDPADHFYMLFVPLIWVAVRSGMAGAIVASAVVQVGVVVGIKTGPYFAVSTVELQALVAALTLTGLYLGMMVDERARAEEELRRSLRLAAAGEMAGAIAHEVNQPLTALANYGRAAQTLLARGSVEAVPDVVGRMMAEAERAADVVRRLRDFFRAGTTRLERVEVAELLAAARRIGTQIIGTRQIALEVRASGELPPLLADRLQVELVLRNLVANAVESLVAAQVAEPRVAVLAEAAAGGGVRFVVSDNGPGVSAATRPGLFEPFVSGKPTGMGLGLAVSRAIAEAHGGTLEAAPAPGHGEFRLDLPCHPST